MMRKCNNARYFYLQRLFSAILRAYHAVNLPGVRGWRGAGQMGDCIGRLVAAGVERATVGKVAGWTSRLWVLEGGVTSTPRTCVPDRSNRRRHLTIGKIGFLHSPGASARG